MKRFLFLIFIGLLSCSGFAQNIKILFFVVDSITIHGNHQTRQHIITREITLKPGDTLFADELTNHLAKSKSNLLNASIFNFVHIDTISSTKPGHIILDINVIERWYIWPYPVFELADRNFNAWWRARNFERVNYGTYINIENFRGRKELLRLLLKFGFDKKFSLLYDIPYINKSQTLGLNIEGGFTGNHEVALKTNDQSEVVFYKNEDIYQRRDWFGKILLTYRSAYNITHYAGFFFQQTRLSDSLPMLASEFWPSQKNLSMYGFLYRLKADYRDYKHYPLHGSYYDTEAYLASVSNESNPSYSLEANYRKFWSLGGKWYASGGLYGRLAETPFLYSRGLGSDRYFARGYEYYLILGQKYFLSHFNLKYNFIPQKTFEIKPIHNDKFGLIHFASYVTIYSDIGYVGNNKEYLNTKLNNHLLASIGLGLDLITYYDKVLRLEYSLNKEGEHGFFVHFMAIL